MRAVISIAIVISSLNCSVEIFCKDLEQGIKNQIRISKQKQVAPSGDHQNIGLLDPPIPIPNIEILTVMGDRKNLRDLLFEKTTAIHLMYTSCKSSCPIQGRLFANLSPHLGAGQQIISISIDITNDQKHALKKWRSQYPQNNRWIATVPRTETDLANLLNVLGNEISQDEPHMNQVYFVDAEGRLVFKTPDFPSQSELRRIFMQLSTKA